MAKAISQSLIYSYDDLKVCFKEGGKGGGDLKRIAKVLELYEITNSVVLVFPISFYVSLMYNTIFRNLGDQYECVC